MKKTFVVTLVILIVCSLCCLSGCNNDKTSGNTPSNAAPKNNDFIGVDTSKLIRVDVAGRIPISTDSIREMLLETGRFDFNKIPFENGVTDFNFSLDKNGGNDGTANMSFQVLPGKSTEIISYNFSKSAVKGSQSEDIKWGLDVLLHILEAELTDEAWSDILEIASKSQEVGKLGTDYEGYKNESAGIRLIYADLGKNVQIDIRAD